MEIVFLVAIGALIAAWLILRQSSGPMERLDNRLEKIEHATQASTLGNATGKACPRCAEIVKRAAAVCRFCGHEFDPATIVHTRTLLLQDAGDLKINVIKEVLQLTGLGLKAAKDLVEAAPTTLLQDVEEDEAQRVQQLFRKIGATVEIV